MMTPRLRLTDLVVRIARPKSLAIWHRKQSHRRPDCSESPNRRHVASLGAKKHVIFWHRSPALQDFRVFSGQNDYCSCAISRVFASSIASDLGVRDSNRITHRNGIARFGPLS